MSIKICLQLWGRKWLRQFYGHLEKMRSTCRKNHAHKIPRFRGGGILGLGGGGSADFIFMGARIFLIMLQILERTKGQMVPFSRMYIPLYSYFPRVFVLREPTQPKKSPGLPCVSLEPELRNRLIRICGPPTCQNTQQMLVCN